MTGRGASARPQPLAQVLRAGAWAAAVTAVGVFHVFCHTRALDAGYALAEAEAKHEELAAARDALEIEVQTRRAPGRIEEYARTRLKMAPPAPGSVVVAGSGGWAAGRAAGGGMVPVPGLAEPVSTDARERLALSRVAALESQRLR